MNEAQRTELAGYLHSSLDPQVQEWVSGRNDTALTDWLNSTAVPDTLAWIETQDSLTSEESPNYTVFDTLTAGKRDSWVLFLRNSRDFSKNKVRKWVTDIWGNATAGSDAEAILQNATKKATNVQALFGGTEATTGTVTALKLVFNGDVTTEDVGRALNDNPAA